MKRLVSIAAAAGGCALVSPRASAAEPATPISTAPADEDAAEADAARGRREAARSLRALTRRGPYARLFGTAAVGDGLRFNNPYRLSRPLGETAESVSRTAPYADFAAGAATGRPDGLQHGAAIAWSWALAGIPQAVLTPSYVALWRGPRRWMLFGRAGAPVVLAPDKNVGGELALGGAWFATASIGATASIVGDGWYGAATRETRYTFYPVLSAQAGVIVDWEVLP